MKFVGKASSMPSGFWVGIELDEPMGKNNGRDIPPNPSTPYIPKP